MTARGWSSKYGGHSGHFREVCRHGITMAQCRCMNPQKTVRLVECNHDDDDMQKPESD